MTRIRNVGGKIIERTKGKDISYAKENIVFNSSKKITFTAKDGTSFGEPEDPPESKFTEFDITFELDKETKTVVPFGILDYKNNLENPFFSFKYSLSKNSIDSLDFQILTENDEIIYQMKQLKTVIVQASKKPEILFKIKKTTEGPLISKTWDFNKIYNQYSLEELKDYTKQGQYFIHWDGFDTNEIYDSTRFNGKKLKAKITATKGRKQKSITIDFSTIYSEVDWTDVKIDKHAKRIDVILRVNLTDGGDKGLNCQTINANMYGTPARTVCDWDKVPASTLNPSHPIIKSRTKTFKELEKLALEGIEKHWSRKGVYSLIVNTEKYELIVRAINSPNESLNELSLVYNTNGSWGRSGNPGFLGVIFYNVGYCNFLNWYELPTNSNWGYLDVIKDKVDDDFKYTSAHELGHSILRKYGGQYYSISHDNSSTILQNPKGNESYKAEKAIGEINLMHYFKDDPRQANYDYNIIVASVKDILGLLWLSKLKIK